MPIFEFACRACGLKRFSELVGVVQNAAPVRCPRCKSTDVTKLVSRFARLRSTDEALDQLADQADALDESDPRAMRRLMKEMAHGMDDDISGGEIEELMDAAIEEEASGGGE